MQLPTHDAIVHRLFFEFDYPTSYVAEFAGSLLQLEPQLQDAFSTWWYTGTIPTLEVEGYTIQRLVDEYRFTIPNAFTTLDWLICEPEYASQMLKRGFCRIHQAETIMNHTAGDGQIALMDEIEYQGD